MNSDLREIRSPDVAAMNPCPCGWLNDPQKACGHAPAVVTKYQKRIYGPLLDRIDIHIEVPRVDYENLSSDRVGESSTSIRKRVQAARDIQSKRFANGEAKDIICNANMRVGEVRQFCKLQDEGQSLMRAAMSQLNLSARTIADLAGSEEIQPTYLAEALHASQSSEVDDGVIKNSLLGWSYMWRYLYVLILSRSGFQWHVITQNSIAANRYPLWVH
ncbi:MAG: ATP-binding protein [Chloroflexi bacterium]|nr:ATP-binding protein [Chloroflexota bacterium]